MRLVLAVTLCLMSATRLVQQPPVRDAAAPPVAKGTAVISGTIVTDENPSQPVRRARVLLNNQDRYGGGWSVTTNDAGQFVFKQIPAGRYTLVATKPAWLAANYGARRPDRPGTPLPVAEGQRIANLTIKMQRGGVITGVVRDRNGLPWPGVTVSTLRYSYAPFGGERTLGRQSPGSTQLTDDRGLYRAYGLPPGEYVVMAAPRLPPGVGADVQRVTDADVQRALTRARAGNVGNPADAASGPRAMSPAVGFASVFYPGTADATSASVITLGAGEELSGVDFDLPLVPTARIDGTIKGPDGLMLSSVELSLATAQAALGIPASAPLPRARPDRDGVFSYAGMTPGTYTITARAVPPAAATDTAASPAVPAAATLYAISDVVVEGRDQTITLELQPGMTLSGRVVFEGAIPAPAPATVSALQLRLRATGSGPALTGASVSPDAEGRVAFTGVTPGSYSFLYSSPANFDMWSLKSAVAKGADMMERPLTIKANQDVNDLILTFTDHPSELSGTLTDSTGRAATDYFIIVFSANRSDWAPFWHRVRQVRPAADGKYKVGNLPSGDYLIAALTDVETGEWYNPAFLAELVRAAAKVTIGDGQKTVMDLKLGGSPRSRSGARHHQGH